MTWLGNLKIQGLENPAGMKYNQIMPLERKTP